MSFPAAAVANEFLELAQNDGKDITPLKMQKLVYFAHGWYLALFDQPLLEEAVEAWDFGPVVASLYHNFKQFGGEPIAQDASVFEGGRFVEPHLSDARYYNDSHDARAVIERVWQQYGPYSASQLVSITHSPDSPWSAVPDKYRRPSPIANEDIRSYFERQIKER